MVQTNNMERSLVVTRIVLYVTIGSFIVIGNILCLAAFLRTKALRRRSYNLLISLSVADLLVGVSTIAICVEDGLSLKGLKNDVLPIWRDVAQYFPRMCSLFTVAAVAIERFWAVGYPTKHRTAGKTPYFILKGTPWALAAVLSLLYLSSSRGYVSESVFNYIDVVLSQVTLLTIIASYCALMRTMKQNKIRNKHDQKSVLKERKLAVTLFVVTLASILTIYPVNIYFIIQIFHKGHHFPISQDLFLFLIALASCNSGINIIVYMFRITEFKRAVLKMLLGNRFASRVSFSTRGEAVSEKRGSLPTVHT